jgi:hypothetical protein
MIETDTELLKDNDSLYVMPLRVLPIESPSIQRARLIKDSHLDSAIELFFTREGGSGQLYLSELDEEMFGDDPKKRDNDLHILENVTKLHSFDVYSLRICLRDAEINIRATEFLTLSDNKQRELNDYMKAFTMPLIKQVYGQDDLNVDDASDIIKLFSDPDMETAISKLKLLSQKLNIKLSEIPKFLEDFSDIYLSFAYFQQYLDEITPDMIDFIDEIGSLKENWQMRQDRRLMNVCDSLENDLNNLIAGITGRFESFNRNTDSMWENITAERFNSVQNLITTHHTTIGGVLCGLGSKMNTWRGVFPTADAGGPVSRAEVLLSDIVPGMDKIVALERSTPLATGS